MSRQVIFDPEARLEFEEAVIWYDEQRTGLGDQFETEVHATIQQILHNPGRFRFVSVTIRRARVEVFRKYGLFFRVTPNFIGIVSVFHGARNPAELRRRLK
jgi:plasmid stabilization system protein ParE